MHTLFKLALTLASAALVAPLACAGSQPAKPSMCAANERVLFGCTLAAAEKKVAICAAGDQQQGTPRFYYAYGKQASAPELRYPANADSPATFTRTHLTLAGNSGGYAYGFSNGDYKYVLYSVSGSGGMENQGLIVQKNGEAKPVKQSKCVAGSVIDPDDDELFRATQKWAEDADIAQHGVPLQ